MSSRPLAHDLLPGLILDFPGGPPAWEMRSLVTLIGASTLCKVRVDEPGLSRFECALLRTPLGAWAVELGGRGGLHVLGERRRLVALTESTPLTVGTREIRPRPMPSARHAAASAGLELARRPNPPASALTPALVDPLPAALAQQFSEMQSEMLEQVRHSLLSMGRWLGSLHREEMERLRAELADLRAEVLGRGEHHSAALPAPPTAPAAPPRTSEPPPPPKAEEVALGEELHRLLVGRIERLQREQKRRWTHLLQRPAGRDG
jgi:hypothetical protein